jgi:hypothetical protein
LFFCTKSHLKSLALAVEIAPASNGVELLHAERLFGFTLHVGKLRAVVTFIGDLVCHNEVVFGFESDLDIKPTVPEPRPLVAMERLPGSVSEIC